MQFRRLLNIIPTYLHIRKELDNSLFGDDDIIVMWRRSELLDDRLIVRRYLRSGFSFPLSC